jgi:hypothetical protein
MKQTVFWEHSRWGTSSAVTDDLPGIDERLGPQAVTQYGAHLLKPKKRGKHVMLKIVRQERVLIKLTYDKYFDI